MSDIIVEEEIATVTGEQVVVVSETADVPMLVEETVNQVIIDETSVVEIVALQHIEITTAVHVVEVGVEGPEGPPGPPGPQNLFIQPTLPTSTDPYLWVQTEMPGGNYTLWFEDGT